MCQSNVGVWVTLEHGKLLIINGTTFKTEHQINSAEIGNDDLVEMITADDHANLVALSYKDGSVVFIKSCLKSNGHREIGEMNSLGFGILEEVDRKHENIKLYSANISSSRQLYAIEACKPQHSEQVELWCGGDNGTIEILVPYSRTSQVQQKSVLKSYISSAGIPYDANIVQLKSSTDTAADMFALHSSGMIISCWNADEKPVLVTVIKLSSPGN